MALIIAKFFLAFGHGEVVIPLLILGYICHNPKIFYHAICLLLLSIILNHALKITFAIPLAPSLGKPGFAFPSGHMQAATVLYGWLAYKSPNIVIRCLVAVILTGLGISLVYSGYHNYSDVSAAVIVAGLLVVVYRYVSSKYPTIFGRLILSLAAILLLYIVCKTNEIPPHLFGVSYALIGIILGSSLLPAKPMLNGIKTKGIASGIYAVLLLCVYQLQNSLHSCGFISLIFSEFLWFAIAIALPGACYLATSLRSIHFTNR